MAVIARLLLALYLTLLILSQSVLAGHDSDASRRTPSVRRLTIASWNVENLFDTLNDPENDWDERYTPQGAARWTAERYRRKLDHLAQVIQVLRPDILCLQEIENPGVLRDLAAVLSRDHALELPYILHRRGEDFRGMDVAIMSAFPAASSHWLTPLPGRRDQLEAVFESDGHRLIVQTHHWKSRVGDRAETRRIREVEATAVRARIDAILAEDPHAALVVTGDFNDDIDDEILVNTARFLLNRQAVNADPHLRALYNLSAELASAARYSFHYHMGNRWHSFDAISVSRGMLPENVPGAGWRIRPGSYSVVRPLFMQDGAGRPLAFRRVRNDRGRWIYQYGYSDHFPVRVEVERTP